MDLPLGLPAPPLAPPSSPAPPRAPWQGRNFAALNVAAALGAAMSNMLGSRLYQASMAETASLPSALRGGALPAVLLAPCFLAATLLVRRAVLAVWPEEQTHRSEDDHEASRGLCI